MARADKRRSRRASATAVTGVLVVDKPPGMTSMDVVSVVRRRAGGARTGHAGTLDPLATGVLVLALGRGTKALSTLMATTKRYRTEIDLSAFTSTDDLEGEREEVEVAAPPATPHIEEALGAFRGMIMQQPPAYSAVKVGGRRAYALARKGETPELDARPVTMHELELMSYAWPMLVLDLHCGKGLYVRRLARDLGAALGTGGHCVTIRRTAVGPFTLEEAVPLDDVPDPLTEDALIDLEEALARVENP